VSGISRDNNEGIGRASRGLACNVNGFQLNVQLLVGLQVPII